MVDTAAGVHDRPGPCAREGVHRQTGIVLNVISCFLLSGYTAGAFQAVYGEPAFALPGWANATA